MLNSLTVVLVVLSCCHVNLVLGDEQLSYFDKENEALSIEKRQLSYFDSEESEGELSGAREKRQMSYFDNEDEDLEREKRQMSYFDKEDNMVQKRNAFRKKRQMSYFDKVRFVLGLHFSTPYN
eukprot:sb/3475905/